jgi:DNA-binding transcriptional LysR family regulator
MDIRELDLNLLLVFDAIYTTGNISRAAITLDISQPAVSNSLARLRKQLDDPLFERSGNGVIATPYAETIIIPVRDALGTLSQSLKPASKFNPKSSKINFRLIVVDPLETIIMQRLLSDRSDNPKITFELLAPQAYNTEEALLTGTVDLTLFLLPPNSKEILSEPVCPIDPVIVIAKDHPRIKNKLKLTHLLTEHFVSLNLQPNRLTNSEKISVWQQPKKKDACLVNKVSSVAQIAAKTELVGVVPRLYAISVQETYGLRILESPIKISNQHFFLSWHERYSTDPAHVWLRMRIKEIVQKAQLALQPESDI